MTGRVLLNLDSENEREVIVGSAGGSRVFIRIPIEWHQTPAAASAVEVRVRGLQGGHSGQQIDDNLMNALKALAYTLAFAADRLGADAALELRVADLTGGRADNAIPREARAVLLVGEKGRVGVGRTPRPSVQRRVRSWRAGADDEAV